MEIKNCKTLQSVEVGQTIYLKPLGNAKRRVTTDELIKAEVTKVAKKYFYVKGPGIWGGEHRFTIDGADGYDHDNNYGYMPYESLEVYEKEARYDSRMQDLQKYFQHCWPKGWNWPSMEAVDKIWDILASEGLIQETEGQGSE